MITSVANRAVMAARSLHDGASRRAEGRFLVEGRNAVEAALDAGVVFERVFVTAGFAAADVRLLGAIAATGAPVTEVADPVFRRLAGTSSPAGIVAVAPTVRRRLGDLPPAPKLLCVLVEVNDPGNAGTVLRMADAVGADAVITTTGSVDLEHPKAVRASAGSVFHVQVIPGVPWPEVASAFRQRGVLLVGADAAVGEPPASVPLDRPCALVFGNEARGLGPQVLDDLDRRVRLPIYGRAESLNLAAAAAVLLYEAARRQHEDAVTVEPGGG